MQSRFSEALARLATIERDYVTKGGLKDEVAPIWKWTSVAGVAIVGALVTYVFTLLRGGSH